MSDFMEQTPTSLCPSVQAGTESPAAGAAGPVLTGDAALVAGWVRAAQGGDRGAMERLLLHFQDRVWRRARYRIGDQDEAWEVAQEVFIICFRKIGQFRGESAFWTWLARIVDNQVRNRQGWWRRRRQDVTYSLQDLWQGEDDEERAWDPPDPGPSPRQQVAGQETLERLEQMMAELSEEHREVLLLRFADNLSYEEIAESMQISLGTVKSRINRARSELRDRMQKFL